MRSLIVTFIFALFAVSTLFASPTPTPVSYILSGTISYADTLRPVPNALILATCSQGHVFTTTDANGFYILTGFLPDESCTVTAGKNAMPNFGEVSSFDAAMIAQFASGLRSFTPLQILAADVSGNGTISNYDAGMVAAYVMNTGVATGLTGTWVFSPSSRVYASVTGTIPDQNFVAVLMGDVSQNWTPPPPIVWPVLTPGLSPSPTPIVVPWPSQTPTPFPSPWPTPNGSPCPPVVCGR